MAGHIQAVAAQAERFGREFDREEEAKTAGLFHDAGKQGERFQGVLSGQKHNVDGATR